jgi:flagellar biosynthesis repressor protein FlbT
MPLRVELKPFERIVIGESVLVNSDARICFLIEGDAPVLRERDVVTEESASTPARRLYYLVQMMYLKSDTARYRAPYADAAAELRRAMPSWLELIDAVEHQVASGALYKALKDVRILMRHEASAAVAA